MKHVTTTKRGFSRIAFACLFLYVNFFLSAYAQNLPLLRVSDNKRFLVRADGKPFFYMGDTAWELFHRLTRDQAIQYLQNRADHKFTVIQAVAIAELSGIETPNAHGDKPFWNNNLTTPAVTSGSSPYDANQYDYWDHVDFIVDEAAKRGMYVALLPTWGSYVVNNYPYFNPTNMKKFGEFLGARYGNKPIIWVMGGDRIPTYSGHLSSWRAMAEGIKVGSGKSSGELLMTFHPTSPYSSSQWFHNDEWLDFNMWQTGHCLDVNVFSKINQDYNRYPVKPVIDGEPLYEDHPICFQTRNGYSGDAEVRRRAYWAVFAGAFGHTYGHHSVWQMYAPGRTGINYPNRYWYDALNRPAATQMKHLRALIESRPFLSRVPDQSIISGSAGTSDNHVQATRGDGYAMVYLSSGQTMTINLGKISGSQVKAWWYDTRTGRSTLISTFANSGTRQFDPPGSPAKSNDWVLVLDDASKNFPAPGNGTVTSPAPVTDTQSPSTPANLATTGKTSSSVNLTWGASSDNVGVAGYEVYNGSTKVNSNLVTGTSFTVSSLSANTTYTFTVRAKDQAGNTSAASNSLTVTTSTASADGKLTGNTFGSSPYWGCTTCTADKAFDNNTSTYFDSGEPHFAYTGIDLGAGNAKRVTKIRFYPRAGFTKRKVGGKFQGSNTSSSSGFVDLHVISVEPSSSWTEVTISNPTAFRYLRYVGPYSSHGNIAEVEFYGTSGTITNPELRTPENPSSTTAGVEYQYYEGSWNVLPSFQTLSPVKTGSQANFSLSARNRSDYFGFRFRGYINVPADGTYTFYTSSDDGSKLFIGDREVVNNDGLHAAQERAGSIGLRAGRHAITVIYFERTGSENLQVSYSGPGISKTAIPSWVLSRTVSGTQTPVTACSGTGSITREYWANVYGTSVANIPLNTKPTSVSQIYSFEAPSYVADNYGQRIRGYVCAPATGNYTFYIAGDDDSELWLSTDENPANKRKIASVYGWTYPGEWNKYASQKSASVYLQQGRRYYIEALHKESIKGDALMVGWLVPNSQSIQVIPGSRLSPYYNSTARLESEESEELAELSLNVYPNPTIAGGEIQLEAQGLASGEEVILTIHNNVGKEIIRREHTADQAGTLRKGMLLDADLPSGMYFITLRTRKGVINQKLVISN